MEQLGQIRLAGLLFVYMEAERTAGSPGLKCFFFYSDRLLHGVQ